MNWPIICIVLASLLYVAEAAKHPHIVILLADDLGHNDVSFLGSKEIPTPNLDALAYDGIILSNYYVHHICTPSRAALLTGRHPTQLGLQQGVISSTEPYGLGLNETLLPEYLKKLGYSSYAFGKWHLGFYAKEFTPTYRGFGSFYGYLQGREDYWDHTYKLGSAWGLDLHHNNTSVKTRFGEYGTDIFTKEAVRTIRNCDPNKPLFIYLAQQGVHCGNQETKTPLEAPWKYVKKFRHIKNKQRRIYAGMVSAVDESMAAVVRALSDKNMLKDSVIFFSTDNGGPAAGIDANQASNWPLRGMKYTLWEGGVRGAAFLWSPLLKQSGYVSRHLLQIEDMFPTLLHAAGYNTRLLPDDLFGKDMWQMLSTDGPSARKEVFHNSNPGNDVKAIRIGDMKLISSSKDGMTAHLDGWYKPPSVDVVQDCRNVILSDPGLHDVIACDETEQWSLEFDPSKEDLEYGAVDLDQFQTDLPDILSKIGRPKRQNVPSIITCNKPRSTKSCNVAVKSCLFNVTADPCEYSDLADAFPELVQVMAAKIKTYETQAAQPRNKPKDPRGLPKYHNGVWEPWINLFPWDVNQMHNRTHF